MTRPHFTSDEIAAIAMGDGDDAALAGHAADCTDCAKEWQSAKRLVSLMDGLAATPAPSEKAMQRTQARVRALLSAGVVRGADPTQLRRPALAGTVPAPSPMRGLTVGAAVLVSAVIAFGLSAPSISPYRILIALATIGVAALLPNLALRSERDAIVASSLALGLSMTLGLLDYTEVRLVAGHAISCFSTELAIGALPLVVMLGMARSSTARLGTLASAAGGAAGALAGQGVLLTTCAADESVLHVLFFHVAGVVVATLVGGGLGAVMSRRAS